jgi:hypothetical protein
MATATKLVAMNLGLGMRSAPVQFRLMFRGTNQDSRDTNLIVGIPSGNSAEIGPAILKDPHNKYKTQKGYKSIRISGSSSFVPSVRADHPTTRSPPLDKQTFALQPFPNVAVIARFHSSEQFCKRQRLVIEHLVFVIFYSQNCRKVDSPATATALDARSRTSNDETGGWSPWRLKNIATTQQR